MEARDRSWTHHPSVLSPYPYPRTLLLRTILCNILSWISCTSSTVTTMATQMTLYYFIDLGKGFYGQFKVEMTMTIRDILDKIYEREDLRVRFGFVPSDFQLYAVGRHRSKSSLLCSWKQASELDGGCRRNPTWACQEWRSATSYTTANGWASLQAQRGRGWFGR